MISRVNKIGCFMWYDDMIRLIDDSWILFWNFYMICYFFNCMQMGLNVADVLDVLDYTYMWFLLWLWVYHICMAVGIKCANYVNKFFVIWYDVFRNRFLCLVSILGANYVLYDVFNSWVHMHICCLVSNVLIMFKMCLIC